MFVFTPFQWMYLEGNLKWDVLLSGLFYFILFGWDFHSSYSSTVCSSHKHVQGLASKVSRGSKILFPKVGPKPADSPVSFQSGLISGNFAMFCYFRSQTLYKLQYTRYQVSSIKSIPTAMESSRKKDDETLLLAESLILSSQRDTAAGMV